MLGTTMLRRAIAAFFAGLGAVLAAIFGWFSQFFRWFPQKDSHITAADGTRLPLLAQAELPRPPEASFSFAHLEAELPSPRPGVFRFEEQGHQWLGALEAQGRAFQEQGFGKAVFVHGTFVGHDPASMMSALQAIVPNLSVSVELALRDLMKRQCNSLLRDNGNFLPDYAKLFAAATGWGRCVENFVWSSGNHHTARLVAALHLAPLLARLNATPGDARGILLVGHSHAGQVFALLARLIQEARGRRDPLLLEALKLSPAQRLVDLEALRALGGLGAPRICFVTLGSPPRYRWFLGRNMRLLSIVNHRGAEPLAGTLSGLFHTRDGDYIQQWGIDGSDFMAVHPWERQLNQALDSLLGTGVGAGAWLAASKTRRRLPESGHTLLVDFHDASRRLPNCVATVFGHGSYTRLAHMLPLMHLVRGYLQFI